MQRALIFSLVGIVLFPINSVAQTASSQLHQTVKPIECVFTRVALVGDTTSESICNNQSAPTLETVTVATNKTAVLSGHLPTTMNMIEMLRVSVATRWYTHGISPLLTASDDTWELDINAQAAQLPPGDHTVIIEVETTDSFLLRSVYERALLIPESVLIETIVDTGPVRTISRYVPNRSGGYIIESRVAPFSNFRGKFGEMPLSSEFTYKNDSISKDQSQSEHYGALLAVGAVLSSGVGIYLWRRKR